MPFLPSMSSGMIFALIDDVEPRSIEYSGSCGALSQRDIVLTASHCVPEGRNLVVVFPSDGARPRAVRRYIRHPSSDIALLLTDLPEPRAKGEPEFLAEQVFTFEELILHEGADYACYGFPAGSSPDDTPDVPNRPTGRTIKGNIQRWFSYSDPERRNYFALELSSPAPAGLSGSVLTYAHAPRVPVGVVTANFDSYVLIDRVDEISRDGVTVQGRTERVVSYGVAASLAGKQQWLTESLEQLRRV